VTYGEDKTKFGYLALNGRWAARPGLVLTGQLSANNSDATSYQDTLSGQIFGVDSTIDYGDDHVYPSMSSNVDYTNPANFTGFDITTGWTRETDKGRQARLVLDYDYDLFAGWTGHLKTGLVYVDTSKGVEKAQCQRRHEGQDGPDGRCRHPQQYGDDAADPEPRHGRRLAEPLRHLHARLRLFDLGSAGLQHGRRLHAGPELHGQREMSRPASCSPTSRAKCWDANCA
jgi:hypothetical protein